MPTLLRLAVPSTLATLVMVSPIVIEAWRLGQIGSGALAGVAMVFPLFMLVSMLSARTIGGAFSGAIARALGAGDSHRARVIARSAIVVALADALLSGLLVTLFGEAIFTLLGGGRAKHSRWLASTPPSCSPASCSSGCSTCRRACCVALVKWSGRWWRGW